MDTIQNLENVVEGQLKVALNNPFVMAVLKVGLVLYASQIAPKLSTSYTIFQYTIVKIICIFLIAYIAEIDFQLSIILAIIFVLSINLLSGRGPLESYKNTEGSFSTDPSTFYDLLGNLKPVNNLSMIEGRTNNYPGCDKITLKDLLDIFDNDAMKLQNTVQFAYHQLMENMPQGTAKENLTKIARAAGLPYNKDITDENAPLLATMLIQFGYIVNNSCSPPHST
jgi:hypothetical protein